MSVTPLPTAQGDPLYEGTYTAGHWETEQQSAQAFDAVITATGRFTIYREVSGAYQWLRPGQPHRTPRIDRIIMPTRQLVEEGWTIGPVAVECKRSGIKTGPPIAQLFDYSHAAWQINHTWFMPQWYLLWPLQTVKSTLQSVFAQQRLGGIYIDGQQRLVLHSQSIIAKFTEDQPPDLRMNNTTAGRKTGSR